MANPGLEPNQHEIVFSFVSTASRKENPRRYVKKKCLVALVPGERIAQLLLYEMNYFRCF